MYHQIPKVMKDRVKDEAAIITLACELASCVDDGLLLETLIQLAETNQQAFEVLRNWYLDKVNSGTNK